jgi:tetratricopeptide (TPR) repeat protein
LSAISEPEVLNLLTRLVEKSLVVYEEDEAGRGCYRLLETVRQYAREKLAAEPQSEIFRRQHRDYFVSVAEDATWKLVGFDQVEWLNRLEAEHDNLRAALEFCADDPGSGEPGLRLAGSLWRFWTRRGYLREGRARLAAALAHPGAGEMSQARGDAINGAGTLTYRLGEFAAARGFFEQALAIRRALGDRRGTAMSLNNLGKVATEFYRDPAAARQYLEESLALLRDLGDRQWFAMALGNLAACG